MGSKTPGHPEFGHTRWVDATTGPFLGQVDFFTATGFCLKQNVPLQRKYNWKVCFNYLFDHYTLCGSGGDGDLIGRSLMRRSRRPENLFEAGGSFMIQMISTWMVKDSFLQKVFVTVIMPLRGCTAFG